MSSGDMPGETRLGRRRTTTDAHATDGAPETVPPESGFATSDTRLGVRGAGRAEQQGHPTAGDTQLGARRAVSADAADRRESVDAPAAGDSYLGQRRSAADPVPEQETGTRLGRRRAVADPGSASATDTRLGHRHSVEDPAAPSTTETNLGQRRGVADPVTEPERRTSLGQRGEIPGVAPTGASEEVVRFGPGVPSAAAAVPGWAPAATSRPARPRRRWGGLLLTVGLVAGALAYVLLRGGDPLTVQAVQVSADSPPGVCDTVVDVVGTIVTNGRPGTLRYEWIRSDGQITAPQSQTVASGEASTPVHLQWSVSGRGRLPAQATLRILEPTPTEATGGFTYSCP